MIGERDEKESESVFSDIDVPRENRLEMLSERARGVKNSDISAARMWVTPIRLSQAWLVPNGKHHGRFLEQDSR